MDDENRAIVHYDQRLVASAFGIWVSWMSETKSMEQGAEVCAVDYSTTVVMEKFIARLMRLVRKSAKRAYSLILADTMRKLLLKRQGIMHLRRHASKQDRLRRNKCANALFTATNKPTTQQRLLWRWKRWYLRREDTSSAICNAISQSGRWYASARNALATWTTYYHSIQQNRSNEWNARQHWVRYKKLNFIGKLRRLAARRSAQRVVESELQAALVRRRLLRGLRALLRLANGKEGCTRVAHAAAELATHQAGHRLLQRLRTISSLTAWHDRSLRRAERHCRLASLVRVFRGLLRGVLKRLRWRAPLRTKVKMFLVHSWATRRKSAALAQWECAFGRNGLENRRQKIALFQHRDRSLRLAFTSCRARLRSLACQRSLVYDGMSHHSTKLLRRGWGALSRYCALSCEESGRQLRATLLWKFRREVLAMKHLREYVQLRKRKRTMLLEARAAYALSERRAACAEFIRVAQATAREGGQRQSERRRRLASWAARRWRRYVAQRRVAGQQYQHAHCSAGSLPPAGSSSLRSGRGAVIPIAAADTPAAYRPDVHLLSRTKPRAFDMESLPLPQPPRDRLLEHRYDPAATDTNCTSDGLRKPYAYLLASTPLSRPLPTSRGVQPCTLAGVGRPLTHDIHYGADYPVGQQEVHKQQHPLARELSESSENVHDSAIGGEDSSALREPAAAPVSEALLLAAEKLLLDGAPSEATSQLLREYLAAHLEAASGGVTRAQ